MCTKEELCEKGKKPGCCSEEQIEECHGPKASEKCKEGKKPSECSDEQIEKCHGKSKHRCC